MHSFLVLQLDRIKRVSIYLFAMFIRTFTKIVKNRIFMWSYHADKYACNPRIITEFLLEKHPDEFEIFWAFEENSIPQCLDEKIKVVKKYSLAYFVAMYSSKYVFTNSRNDKMDTMFNKKKGQKYIMTWHSSMRLKMVEGDAIMQLSKSYIRKAKADSKMCDLMFSNSKFTTRQLRTAFWFNGEILDNCIPRNTNYYNESLKEDIYVSIREKMGFSQDTKIVLYAPTFRGMSLDLKYYKINWDIVIPQFEKMLGGDVKVLLRLHPNLSKLSDLSEITNFENVYDITKEPDIQEYMFAADTMISDYTSAMFDSIILRKPCFIYAIDKDEYDRGFYWRLEELPFSVSTNSEELADSVRRFDAEKYFEKIERFKNEEWGLEEDGKACERLYEWLKSN